MLAKIISVRAAVFILALAAVITGCTPAGPRALLQGKKNLDAGDYAAAVEQLKTATTLLATNANAWNYYGVALQRAGQPDDAATAYQTALKLDRDLVEAHFNLGSLWLEQNKPDAAKAELTAYTLRRPNDMVGWLKLGSTQLKLGEIVPAERSFSTVYHLDTNNAEALHGLGLARIKRGKPGDAAQFFAAAVKAQPDFAPALLDLAIVNHQYLHDNTTALKNYRAYLELSPRPANWDEVNALANSLEQMPEPAPPPAAKPVAPALEPKPQPKVATVVTSRPPVAPKPPMASQPEPKAAPGATHPAIVANLVPAQVVQVPPAPPIVTTPPAKIAAAAPAEPLEVPMPEPVPEQKSGFWHKLFGSEKTSSAPRPLYLEKGLTPLPSSDEPAPRAPARPAAAAPAPPSFTRYHFLSPAKPAAGDRIAASGAFTKAQVFEQGEQWINAEQWYQQAATFDPSWFEAQFNTAVLAHRLRNYALALPHYELALALRPDSVETRYDFAQALQAAGHAPDAADELRKILAANPGEVRAHLALANLCAQTLHDPAQARQHYLKVLELNPKHPQAADIGFWLAANPG